MHYYFVKNQLEKMYEKIDMNNDADRDIKYNYQLSVAQVADQLDFLPPEFIPHKFDIYWIIKEDICIRCCWNIYCKDNPKEIGYLHIYFEFSNADLETVEIAALAVNKFGEHLRVTDNMSSEGLPILKKMLTGNIESFPAWPNEVLETTLTDPKIYDVYSDWKRSLKTPHILS